MNLSLIIAVILLAIVLPWLLRRFLSTSAPRQTVLLEPSLAVESDDKIIEEKIIVQPKRENIDIFSQNNILSEPLIKPGPPQHQQKDLLEENTLQTIYVMAPKGQYFMGYELLQALQNAKLHYGARQIFHCHENDKPDEKIHFSVASAVEPGSFNLQEIGVCAIPGLVLFMDEAQVAKPEIVYQMMQKRAEQLAEELNGTVRYGH